MEEINEWGLSVIRAFQSVENMPFSVIAMGIDVLFETGIYIAIVFLFYWCIDTKKGFLLGMALLLSTSITASLKQGLAVPRPYTQDPSVFRIEETSWSLPSGHSQAAAVFFPLLAGIQRKWKLWVKLIVAIALPLIVGLSRMYLGVHYPLDVLAGWGIGFAVALIFMFFARTAFQIAEKLPTSYKILVLAVIAFVFNWLASDSLELPALIFGFGTGYVLLSAHGGFNASSGNGTQKVLRVIIGVALVALVFWLLKIISPNEDSNNYALWKFIRYGLVSFTGSYIVPKLFIATKLGTPISHSTLTSGWEEQAEEALEEEIDELKEMESDSVKDTSKHHSVDTKINSKKDN